MTKKKKAPDRNCPTCGRLFPVYRNGAMRAHRTPRGDERCKGSFRQPTLPAPTFNGLKSLLPGATPPTNYEDAGLDTDGQDASKGGPCVTCGTQCSDEGICPRCSYNENAPTNGARADAALYAIRAAGCMDEDDPQTSVGDLLCSLRHYCEREGLSFSRAMNAGKMHWQAERGDGDESTRAEGNAEHVERLRGPLAELLDLLSNDVFTDSPERERSVAMIENAMNRLQGSAERVEVPPDTSMDDEE